MSHLRALRTGRNWTQAELARISGVSRSGIAAIEAGALVPSVNTALALARAMGCTVEELFADPPENAPSWAWEPPGGLPAYWEAAFDQRVLVFPVEPLPYTLLPPDGWFDDHPRTSMVRHFPGLTLIMASCDPAAGYLAAVMNTQTGVRVLPFHRSSNEALRLLKKGVIHVAGIHLREIGETEGNASVVRDMLGKGYRLLRGAEWHEGVAVRPGEGLTTQKKVSATGIRWIGRKEGSGARRCQDKVLSEGKVPRHVAQNHWEVAMAVRHGWVDAGICHRLAAEYAELEFLLVSREAFDFCYPSSLEDDPRIAALRRVVRSPGYRSSLAGFKGIDTRTTGDEETV